jgi:enoyl-CoA hydratase
VRISRREDGDVVTLAFDDGKANAMGTKFFEDLGHALDETSEAAAVVLTGRPGMFSGGLDRNVVEGRGEALVDLLVTFGRTMLRVWLEPRPVVVAAAGHAVAAGTILALAADHAVAADGPDYRWGLIETTIGMPLPLWVIGLARANVRADRLEDLLLPGSLVNAATAVDVGYADVAVPLDDVVPVALARAAELAKLSRTAYADTKRRLRETLAATALEDLEQDTRDLLSVAG